jgi:hypothetical protein
MSAWISVKDRIPEEGQIVVAWLSRRKEPACVRYTTDKRGPLWKELVLVDIYEDREDLVSHWLELPSNPM